MPYSQSFGLSRLSPLNNNGDKLIPYWDAENRKWYNVGDEGHDGRTEADREKRIENIKSEIYDKPKKTVDEKPKNKWTRDPKNWETWPHAERPTGWSIPGAKNPDGTSVGDKNNFNEYELDSASKISENKTSQAMLEGGESWENSERNNQPKKGYDDQGRPMTLHDGEKITFDGEDITESHNRKLSGKLSTEDKLDNVQAALGVGGFTPGYGLFSDAGNALLSTGRGVASMFGVGNKSAMHHFKNAGASTVYAFPGAGDIAALNKVNKYSKKLNQFTRSTGSTYQASKSGKWAQEMFKPNSSLRNNLRGLTSWAVGKNKDTRFGNKIKQMFGKDVGGTIAAATSSKGLVKGGDAADTLSAVGSGVSGEFINPLVSSLQTNVTPFTGPIVSDKPSPPAHSIIEENNRESASKT